MSQRPGASPRLDTLKKRLLPIGEFITRHHQVMILVIVFLIHFLLVSPSLMPAFAKVNPDDEAKYVESGWRLLSGNIRDLAWGPVVALVYAPLHLVVGHDPGWFMLETWAGRFVLYAFLWWCMIALAYQVKGFISPYLMSGVLFIVTPFFMVLANQSDAVFLGFSMLALGQLIRFTRHKKLVNLILASTLVGFGILARVETIVLVVILALLAGLFGRGKSSLVKILLGSIIPAAGVLLLYFLISLLMTGSINLGIAYKSYDSFEMNQAILTGGDIDLARQESRRLFGTEEENHGSILRAILRNPGAFAQRILANAKTIPVNYLAFFGKKLGPVIFLFALWGGYELIRKRSFVLLAILLIWPLHSLVSLGFLSLHIVPQVIYLPILLGAIGIAGVFASERSPIEKLAFFGASLSLLLFSWLANKPAFTIGFLLVACLLLLYLLVPGKARLNPMTGQLFMLILLAAGLILREPFSYPNYPVLGASADEQAIYFMEKSLPPLTTVLAPTPLQAIASRMAYSAISDVPSTVASLGDLQDYLKSQGVAVVYLDGNRRVRNDLYDLFESGFEQRFALSYTSPDGVIRIFQLK